MHYCFLCDQQGDFVRMQASGDCRLTIEGHVDYVGQMKNDRFDGYGKAIGIDGTVKEGIFSEGKIARQSGEQRKRVMKMDL